MEGGTAGTSNDLNRLSATSSSGGGGGLARFRSAPATWLDALLEDDDSLKLSAPHHPPSTSTSPLTHLLTSSPSTSTTITPYIPDPHQDFFQGHAGGPHQVTSSAFQRMNSSPAEFLSGNVDAYFSSYGLASASGYDFVGPTSTPDVDFSPSAKRHHSHQSSPSFPSHRPRGDQLSATTSGLLDLEMEKLLEDSVPCRVRAKRGCATHPRSIAERVRRTKISDRIRKLQELVPNMDKQTNTSDMLDEAVEYVKTLQRQIQELMEQQKKCTCMAKS